MPSFSSRTGRPSRAGERLGQREVHEARERRDLQRDAPAGVERPRRRRPRPRRMRPAPAIARAPPPTSLDDLADDDVGPAARRRVASARRAATRPSAPTSAARRLVPPRSMPTASVASASETAQPGHARAEVRRAEGERAEHDVSAPARAQQRNGVLADAAVGGEHDVAAPPAAISAPRLAQAGRRRCASRPCPFTPIEVPSSVRKRSRGRQRCHAVDAAVSTLEHEAGGDARGARAGRAPPRPGRVLGMEADQVGAGVGELLDLRQEHRVGHHQVHMQRQRRGGADARPRGRGRTGAPARNGRRRRRHGGCRRGARSGRDRRRAAGGRRTRARTRASSRSRGSASIQSSALGDMQALRPRLLVGGAGFERACDGIHQRDRAARSPPRASGYGRPRSGRGCRPTAAARPPRSRG